MQILKRWLSYSWTESPETVWSKMRARMRGGTNDTFENYVWCLSTGRVGTHTIAALGQLCPEILSLHEPKPLLFGLGKCAYDWPDDPKSNVVIDEALNACRGAIPFDGQRTYFETSPHVTFLARHLLRQFPSSKFIHVVRHPGEVVRSGMRRKWYAGNPTDKWRIHPETSEIPREDWERMTQFEKNIWSWSATNRWIDLFLDEISDDTKLTIKSEALFSGDTASLAQLFQLLGTQVPAQNRIERVLGKKLNAQQTGEYRSKEEWSETQLATLERLAGRMMSQCGYDVAMV